MNDLIRPAHSFVRLPVHVLFIVSNAARPLVYISRDTAHSLIESKLYTVRRRNKKNARTATAAAPRIKGDTRGASSSSSLLKSKGATA